jgi:hypothetical protein
VVTASDTTGNESVNSIEVSLTAQSTGGGGGGTGATTAWINEIHYDNKGSDRSEFVEIAGLAGTDVSGWSLEAYNGNGGSLYKVVNLSGVISDQQNCMGTLGFNFSGLQNGAPDGISLVDSQGNVLDFISYEGTMTANNGAASGMTSNDIQVAESSSTSKGKSLQMGGNGANATDFTWQTAQTSTKGQVNTNQTLDGCSGGGDTTAPAMPQNLSANAGDAQVILTWDANTENDLAGYDLFRSTSTGGPYNQVNATIIVDTMYIDSAVSNGTTYYYILEAIDSVGNISVSSNEASASPTAPVVSNDVWINEFHYDNSSTDVGEFVEIAGAAGIDMSGWQIVAYNGSNGTVYKTVNLSGIIPNQQNQFGTLAFDIVSIQNGAPDGLALVNNGVVIEFISYEGVLTANNGPASGMTSTNIGVKETSSTPAGFSLQRAGSGVLASDFVFAPPQAETYGLVNTGQTF